ncbi:hypothetical protein [Brucella sp. BZ]|uniref:hypothetical protein n=1 Tax=Brucella sp. BZ TaxID=3381346 RepID=UPI0039EBF881
MYQIKVLELLEDGTSRPYEFYELEPAQEFVRRVTFDLKVWIEGYDMFDRDEFLKLRSMPQDEAIPF